MTREETIKWLESLKAEIGKSEHRALWHYAEAIEMAIKALKRGASDDLISRAEAIRVVEKNSYRMAGLTELKLKCEIDALPSADRPSDEEDQLKFYYVESIDDYWIGMRIDNFYYADWHEGLGFVWSKSRYLPWEEHITDKKTLWEEHTYPSEPVEMPFTDWIVGFVKKYFADRPRGEWIPCTERMPGDGKWAIWCSNDGVIGIARFKEDCYNHFYPNGTSFGLEDAVAWMPLPEPYKGGDDK